MQKKILGIILINYKNELEVVSYIQNELSKINVENKIIVIDNSCSIDGFNNLLGKTKAIDVTNENPIIKSSDNIFAINPMLNLGYAKGNNLGAQFLLDNFNCKYMLFSNTDITIIDENVVEELIEKMEKLPLEISAINPKIVGLNNREQSPYSKDNFWKRCFLYYSFFPLYSKIFNNEQIKCAKEGVYYRLHGCFLLTKTVEFVKVGMFDSETFLYMEESILAERLNSFNKKCYYYPNVKIQHHDGQTTKHFVEKLGLRKTLQNSILLYFVKYRKISKVKIFIAKSAFEMYNNIYYPLIKFFIRLR